MTLRHRRNFTLQWSCELFVFVMFVTYPRTSSFLLWGIENISGTQFKVKLLAQGSFKYRREAGMCCARSRGMVGGGGGAEGTVARINVVRPRWLSREGTERFAGTLYTLPIAVTESLKSRNRPTLSNITEILLWDHWKLGKCESQHYGPSRRHV
jgi:hypothetical protein